MRILSKAVVSSALVVVAAGSLAAAQSAPKPAAKKPMAAAATAVLVGVEELKWVDVPGTPAKMAVVKGDSQKGAHSGFIKLPAGFSAPLHHHSADHQVVVVAGTITLTPEGGAAKKLAAGSWFEFTGMKKHVTTCDPGADCVLFNVSKGAWDLVPVDAPKK
jgi:quercetin dioxygenase-like cupin family protein